MRPGSPAGSTQVQVCGNKALSLLMYVQESRCREFYNINMVSSGPSSAPPTIWTPSAVNPSHSIFSLPVPMVGAVHMPATFCRRGILP